MFKQKGGGVKGFLDNVKKNCTFLIRKLPLFDQFLLAVFLPYQLLGFPCRLESLGQLVNLTKLSLSAVLSSHLESKSLYFMQYSYLESESLY